MINERSLAALAAARLPGGRVRPLYDSYCFSRIPGTILGLFGDDSADALPGDVLPPLGAEPPRVVAVLADAVGWAFVERYAERAPLLARMREQGVVSQLTSQFPSTTSAHVTTLHTTQPVGEHGLYEWNIYEPSLERVVCPLLAAFAGEDAGGLLAAGADLGLLYPQADGLARRVARRGVTCNLVQPAHTVDSPYTRLVCGGAPVHGFATAREGAALAAALAQAAAPSLTVLYLDDFDTAGHDFGPGDPRSEAVLLELLDALEQELADALAGIPGALVLLFADHGQVAADPERCVYVNERCPELVPLLRTGADGLPLAPAGSARDLFLHVREGALDDAAGLLAALFGDDAWVVPTAALAADGVFGPVVSERFRERVGDLVVLPREGVEAWWHEPGRFAQTLRGHHGGLEPAEAETWLGALVP
ncbi:MAG TPA: alkaline phosphatase family protein [Gaiellales bacterium]